MISTHHEPFVLGMYLDGIHLRSNYFKPTSIMVKYLQITVCLIAIISSNTSWCNIINVPDDYETIQDATENAEAYDTILVADGEYSRAAGFVYEPSPIWFIGDPNGETIIDLQGDRQVGFSTQYADINVENFIIRNGRSDGVLLRGCHGIIKNCYFKDLSAGIVVTERSGSVEIFNCKFEDIPWTLHLDLNNEESIITRNLFINCGIGIDISSREAALIENNTIVNLNTAILIRSYGASYFVKNNIISSCATGLLFSICMKKEKLMKSLLNI